MHAKYKQNMNKKSIL